jgi:hypothetical protein
MESMSEYSGGAYPRAETTVGTYSTKTGKSLPLKTFLPKRWKQAIKVGRQRFRSHKDAGMFQWRTSAFSWFPRKGKKKARVVWDLPHSIGAARGQTLEIVVFPSSLSSFSARLATSKEVKTLQNSAFAKKARVERKHTLLLKLPHFGRVFLVPMSLRSRPKATLLLVRGKTVVQKLSNYACNTWTHHQFAATAMRDIDRDGKPDLVVMGICMTGVGPTGARGFPVSTIYYFRNNRYVALRQHRMIQHSRLKTIAKVVRYARAYWKKPERSPRRRYKRLRGRVARGVTKAEFRTLKRLVARRGRKIARKHTLWFRFRRWGAVYLVSFLQKRNGRFQARFALVKKGRIFAWLPSFEGNRWWVEDIVAITSKDIDGDGRRDLIVMADCMTGIGPNAARSFRVTSVYFQRNGFFSNNQKMDGMLSGARPRTLRKAIRLARRLVRLQKN